LREFPDEVIFGNIHLIDNFFLGKCDVSKIFRTNCAWRYEW